MSQVANVQFKNTDIPAPSKVKYDESRKMLANCYDGKESLKIKEVPVPIVTDPTDVVVKITASTVCGSDLHLYHGKIPQTMKGDILGHEGAGVVEEVGSAVTKFKKGDRVCISSVIACGQCHHCRAKEYSACETSNQDGKLQKTMYGHVTAGMFGYSHTAGGFDGCQAEYVRVPFAEVNLFPIPNELSDKQGLIVADFASTGYHGTELADIQPGDNVVVFGCGPVGLMAIMWSQYRGAQRVIGIDVEAYRLEFAKKHFGVTTINPNEENQFEAVRKIFPEGPNKIIDCVGFRFPDNIIHKVEMALKLETDAPSVVNTALEMVRKNGTVALIGDYIGYANHFNLGAIMMKHIKLVGGIVWPHMHYPKIFEAVKSGKVDPTVCFTHTFPLSKIDEAYKLFDKHEDNVIKCFIVPDSIYNQNHPSS